MNAHAHYYLFPIHPYLSPRSGRFRVIVCWHSRLFALLPVSEKNTLKEQIQELPKLCL